MPAAALSKLCSSVSAWYYLTYSWEDMGSHTFPKGICPKVNVIVRLEFELAYYDSTVHRFNHYTTGWLIFNGLSTLRRRRYPAKTITDTNYAAILANTPNQAETLLHSLERAAAGIGLYVNVHKTECMCYNQTGNISTLRYVSRVK